MTTDNCGRKTKIPSLYGINIFIKWFTKSLKSFHKVQNQFRHKMKNDFETQINVLKICIVMFKFSRLINKKNLISWKSYRDLRKEQPGK